MSLPRVHAAVTVTVIMQHKAWFLHEQHQSNSESFVSVWLCMPLALSVLYNHKRPTPEPVLQ